MQFVTRYVFTIRSMAEIEKKNHSFFARFVQFRYFVLKYIFFFFFLIANARYTDLRTFVFDGGFAKYSHTTRIVLASTCHFYSLDDFPLAAVFDRSGFKTNAFPTADSRDQHKKFVRSHRRLSFRNASISVNPSLRNPLKRENACLKKQSKQFSSYTYIFVQFFSFQLFLQRAFGTVHFNASCFCTCS